MHSDFVDGKIIGITNKKFNLSMEYGNLKKYPDYIDIHGLLNKDKLFYCGKNRNDDIQLFGVLLDGNLNEYKKGNVYEVEFYSVIEIGEYRCPIRTHFYNVWIDLAKSYDNRYKVTLTTKPSTEITLEEVK